MPGGETVGANGGSSGASDSSGRTSVWRGILDKIVIRSFPVKYYIVLHGHVPGDTISHPRCCPIVMAMPLCRTTCCYIVPNNTIS